MTFHENSLRNTRILDSWLDDVDGIIVKIVVNDALSDSVILIRVLNNWFLEVTVEAQYL